MRLTLYVSLLSVFFLVGCEVGAMDDVPQTTITTADTQADVTKDGKRIRKDGRVDYIRYHDEPMKPAYRTALEALKYCGWELEAALEAYFNHCAPPPSPSSSLRWRC